MELPEAAIKATNGGVLLSCHVQPGAKRSGLAGSYGDAVKIALKAPPVDNRANEELRRLLAELCGIARSQVTIKTGTSSRSKQVLLSGLDINETKQFLMKK